MLGVERILIYFKSKCMIDEKGRACGYKSSTNCAKKELCKLNKCVDWESSFSSPELRH